MVEATHDKQDGEPEEQKTFVEDPAILDKFKAAALISDGKYRLLIFEISPMMF